MNKKNLKYRETMSVIVDEHFSFEKTFFSPSRFPSKLELYNKNKGCYYLPLNLGFIKLGLKYYMCHKQLCVDIFSERELSKDSLIIAKKEIKYRLSLNNNYSQFYSKYENDRYLKDIINRNREKQKFRMYSLYENLIVSTFLQNATVQRTIKMCQNMLERYGTLLCFNGIELYAMWRPEELKATDEELRALKLGYRSKNILRITEHFINNEINESELREMPTDKLEKELLEIYGVGKQTVFYLIDRPEYLKHIPLWERKILSKYLFDKELVEEKILIEWFHTQYGQWCGMALTLIFEDIFYQHKKKPFPWLKKIMREK
ncbi:hypothetical protein C5S29_03645 [ANME-1 cluster archaeon GoMg3.2]|jgi:3-methyladenine DNA glycosylase/8-oxoguanine DNA glycosylase|nr:hypothetical protein [ANME-1 cluster archaeon GoMg3.2]